MKSILQAWKRLFWIEANRSNCIFSAFPEFKAKQSLETQHKPMPDQQSEDEETSSR